MRNNLVGVIGGLGPMATAKFMEIVINNTEATCDQENVDMLICQYSSIPDRTAYILDDSKNNPVYEMIEAAKLLENNNVLFIVMPCNTATYFYDEVAKSVNIPILNIVKETVNNVIDRGIKKVGLMATDGTIQSGVYDKYAEDKLEIFKPNEEIQKKIMSIIYDEVKQNKIPSKEELMNIIKYFKDNNCEAVIAGCTELSVAFNQLGIDLDKENIVDSLTVLAKKTIILAGKNIKK